MRTTTILLAAIGLLLVGVAVTRTPGQQVSGPSGACCYPGGCLETGESTCLFNGGTWHGAGATCAETDCTPPTTLVSVAAYHASTSWYLIRHWSDGQVDRTRFLDSNACVPNNTCVVFPGTCTTDIDRDGDTGINDFLTLLGEWGPCP